MTWKNIRLPGIKLSASESNVLPTSLSFPIMCYSPELDAANCINLDCQLRLWLLDYEMVCIPGFL